LQCHWKGSSRGGVGGQLALVCCRQPCDMRQLWGCSGFSNIQVDIVCGMQETD